MTPPRRPSPLPALRAVVLAAVAITLAGCGFSAATTSPSPAVPSPAPTAAAATASAAPSTGAIACPTSQPPAMSPGRTATVTLTTEKGPIVIKVEGGLGPNAAGNFVALASCGYYDGVVFHRLVPGFVIQGGDGQFGRKPNLDSSRIGSGGPAYTFPDDPVTVPYSRGTVAMANSGPDTNGSQFFIVLQDSGLAPSYSVFGHVTSGMDVVDAIAAMPNGGGDANLALQPVAITKATVSP
jgi:cyclophilin family peptidyl-prolyl cis-trans isomerase